ncbi:MAG: hypothetical protein A2Z99_09895 [Treponema sp. GWB1_62_6]|nr:MAG: hypothetical protein A2Y36_17855 [Treponema sp. GWA1_62_8]OHE63730.1 MAG: hypothetical protein A2001_00740 [Treponema sp. GWC1_61_84]OHE69279.1 MAG: hypothetical protein A2413_09010 [Treponema sp. RIFOXYC1_FULL_61_9]OHE72140.1 MAG: hypothetical protein A2Z99_09895 [Treponema sp. GWB1_62_6]HCM28031.1 hypothetical protein [Treponema sp.]
MKDALIGALSLAAIVLVAAAIDFAASWLPGSSEAAFVEAPAGLLGWSAMLLSSATTGYMEETFFRAYMLTRLKEYGASRIAGVVASVVLFTVCHLYEGPLGLANAAFAGLVLSVAYLRSRSVHGPAWAHAAYNTLVFATGQ